jgi:outer membrane protein
MNNLIIFACMRLLTFILILSATGALCGQGKSWTLEQCIQYAIDNSLDIKDAELNVERAELSYNAAKLNMIPDLTGAAGQYYQSGRSIDRFTNTYVQKGISSTNYSLQSSIFLYAGGQVRNSIRSGKYSWMASEADLKTIEQSVALNVANLFLQIAQAKELVKSTSENIESTKAQLDRAEKQFEVGAVTEGPVLNLKAQLANDEASLINASNQETNALVSLKMLLRISFEEEFDIILPSVGEPLPVEYAETLSSVYASALSKRPDILAADLRVTSSMFYKKYARGAMYPALSLGANLGTVYSSNALKIKDTILGDIIAIGKVKGTNQLVEAQRVSYGLETIKYGQQMRNNFGQTIGLNLSVPIFNRFSERNNYKFASLDLERNKINLERTKQNLYNEVVGVYTAYGSAMNRYKAAQISNEAQKLNLEFVQKRFDGGQGNATELQMAKATEAMARVNLVSVKYEYIFRKMILDFYMGKKLEFN